MNFLLGFIAVVLFTALCSFIFVYNDSNEEK
jgi:hypothetical protein